MLLMITKFFKVQYCWWMCRMHKLLYKRQFHGWTNLRKGGKKCRRLALKVGGNLENLKLLSKPYSYQKSSCLKKSCNSSKPSSLVIWKAKNYHFTTMNFERPNVTYHKGNHIILEPWGHHMCCEPIPWSLTIISCFNHYPNYQVANWNFWNGIGFKWDKSFKPIWFWTTLPNKHEGKNY
jgi:hypothetical protein